MKHALLHGDITDRILKCAVDVHRRLGPGLPEKTYQRAMVVAMTNEQMRFAVEPALEMSYQGVKVGRHKPDFIVENAVVVELKAVRQLERSVSQQILTYLRVTGLRVGLVINFNAPIIPLGVKRFVL